MKHPTMRIALALGFMVALGVGFPLCGYAEASGSAAVRALPENAFFTGWTKDGAPETFSRDSLYQHINGEAEMYLPYGFEDLASAYYADIAAKKSLEVNIFTMGSSLDAFGIYSNYRDAADETIPVGAGGIISESQLMFYQDRYFVRLSAPSSKQPERKAFMACAEAISKQLPSPSVPPKELKLLDAPEITARTEKFTANSLLGYAFFPKGLTAEATLDGKPLKFFVVLTGCEASASAALNFYVEYLKKEGGIPQIDETSGKTLLAKDPLYKGVVVRQSGPHLLGILKLDDAKHGLPLLDRWVSRLKGS